MSGEQVQERDTGAAAGGRITQDTARSFSCHLLGLGLIDAPKQLSVSQKLSCAPTEVWVSLGRTNRLAVSLATSELAASRIISGVVLALLAVS